jgi:uncharacterized membrane protein YeiB
MVSWIDQELSGCVAASRYGSQALGWTDPGAVATATGFFVLSAVISVAWKRVARNGPLEWLMRRVAG